MKRTLSLRLCLLGVVFFSYACASTDALFSPDDRPKNKLIEYISAAKKKVYAAVYMLTDKDITQALIEAKQRGVDVRMVVDPISVENHYAQGAAMLHQSKVPVFVFQTKQHMSGNVQARTFAPLMHNKFAVIDGLVWTGSFNWTLSANSRNHENVIITNDKNVCQKYEKQFALIVQRCQPMTEFRQPKRSMRSAWSLKKIRQLLRKMMQ